VAIVADLKIRVSKHAFMTATYPFLFVMLVNLISFSHLLQISSYLISNNTYLTAAILSPMLFTHYRPGHTPFFSGATRTMQIFSIKVTLLEGFEWPLEVFGVVAARDAVDYRRNILFLRTRDDCQFLTEHVRMGIFLFIYFPFCLHYCLQVNGE
jgi:hypothetical protein